MYVDEYYVNQLIHLIVLTICYSLWFLILFQGVKVHWNRRLLSLMFSLGYLLPSRLKLVLREYCHEIYHFDGFSTVEVSDCVCLARKLPIFGEPLGNFILFSSCLL